MSDTTDDMECGAAMYESYLEEEEDFEFEFNEIFFWQSQAGTKRILEMDDNHLENCVRKIEKGKIRLNNFNKYLLMKNTLLERRIAKLENKLERSK